MLTGRESVCPHSMVITVTLFLLGLQLDLTRAFTVHTQFGQDFEAYCPKGHFVSNFEIHKGLTEKNEKDIRFLVECDTFLKGGGGTGGEKCSLKSRFPIPHGVLLMDNHYKSCSCDEYLAGIKSYTYRRVRRPQTTKDNEPTLESVERQRMAQLRCCHSSNAIHNISACYYTGLKFMMAPWETQIRTRPWKEPREAIQTFSMHEDYINARVCSYLIKGKHIKKIKYKVNHCKGTKKRGLKHMLNKFKEWAKGKCKFPKGNPFGWGESANSRVSEKGLVLRHKRLYKKQMHMCRDGNYLYALYKFARNGTKGKDYIFLTRCHEITYAVCECKWKMNCTKPAKRTKPKFYKKTYYLGGWRSKWDDEMGRRTVEVFCCKSKGLKMIYCNTTKNFTDRDTSLVINRPRYKWNAFKKPKVIDGEIIRDIDQWYINGSLILRFNICRVNGSDGTCSEKCPDCKEIDLDISFLKPIPLFCTTTTVDPSTVESTTEISTTTTATECSDVEKSETRTACSIGGLCECLSYCETTYATQYNGGRCDGETCVCIYVGTAGCATNPVEPCMCSQKFDFAFLIDRSTSVRSPNFVLEKNFFVDFAKEFTIGDTETRVSWITFSTAAETQFTFESITQSISSVTGGISSTTYPGGWTHITQALENTQPIFASMQRPGVPQVVFLATDGRHNKGNVLPTVPAQAIRANGAFIFVVGIGDDTALDKR